MNQSDVLTALQNRMGTVYSKIGSDGIDQAVSEATQELAWSLPIPDENKQQCFWFIRRAYRWAINVILTESADKFKHKQENLQHRFSHYSQLIEKEDSDFQAAIENSPGLFAGVDLYKMFGETIGPGFKYDIVGRDVTYNEDPDILDVQKDFLGI